MKKLRYYLIRKIARKDTIIINAHMELAKELTANKNTFIYQSEFIFN